VTTIDFHGVRLGDDALTYALGTYEPQEMSLADQLFEAGDRVVVAGCGMGWLAAWIARRVGPANVLGVEPLAHLVELVRQNVEVDGVPLAVRHGALTPGGTAVEVREDPECWALTRTRPWNIVSEGVWAPGVDLRPLQAAGWDCLALDIEGGEVDVLTEEVLRRCRKLLVDLHRFAVDTTDLEKRIEGAGLRLVGEHDRMPTENATHQAWARW